jgi:predicted nucleotidyltransferase component of viral defense system
MSKDNTNSEITYIDLASWVQKGKNDPLKYRMRQVTEILLHALRLTPNIGKRLYLKGGILMAIAYGSPRTTTDIDFTAAASSNEPFADELINSLDVALARSAADLGYSLVCRVQRVEKRPRPEIFGTARGPALKVTLGTAERTDSREMQRLQIGQAYQVLHVDISFNEPVGAIQELILEDEKAASPVQGVLAYAITDLIAEKLRGLLQQVTRNRARRQDVYDISHLIDCFSLDDDELSETLRSFREKCQAREIVETREALADPEVVRRARAEWGTLKQEIEEPLPDFDSCFQKVLEFYERLPWH